MKELLVDLKENSYKIIIQNGLLNNIGREVREVFTGEKIFIITDDNVNGIYGEKVVNLLKEEGYNVDIISLPPGEETKSFNVLPSIYDKMLDFKLTRKDIIITLGGGVIGDLGGFVASTFLRGIPFIQVPTTLLSQVDSSVGGKVGVDLERGKNLVGSFYQPKKVIMDPETLNTLTNRVFFDGAAEVIKYGCIKDKSFFDLLKTFKSREEIMLNIEEVLYVCCNIKRVVVEKDEKDLGDRMLLNFGHTIGHAIEKYYNFSTYTHGEAVAIGMYNISKISEKHGITDKGVADEIKEILIQYGLPYEMKQEDMGKILEAISLDKKNLGNILKIILLNIIGESIIYDSNLSFFS
ncbi:MAG: 3-dehydroquinate synthase [Clostridium sp.]